MKPQRRLRLIAANGNLVGPPPPPPPRPIANLDEALTVGRLAAAIISAEPDDLYRGYTPDEIAAQYAATDRLVQAFRYLDHTVTGAKRSKNEHPHERKPTREKRTK